MNGTGILLGYQITYRALDYSLAKSMVKTVPLTTREYTFTGLFYYWRYEIKIGGYTRPGVGVEAIKIVRTDEHCKWKIDLCNGRSIIHQLKVIPIWSLCPRYRSEHF